MAAGLVGIERDPLSWEVRELLEIPEPWATCAFVPIGWPERGGHGPLARRPVEQVAFADRFGQALFASAQEDSR